LDEVLRVCHDGTDNNKKDFQVNIVLWDQPIRAGGLLIFGPLEAKEFISRCWSPIEDGNFAAASDAILAALDERGSPDLARELFEIAIRSADLG
jgi:hypothetical protein